MRDDLSPKAAEIKVFPRSPYFLLSGCSEPCHWDAELFVPNASFVINDFKIKTAGYCLSVGLTIKLLMSLRSFLACSEMVSLLTSFLVVHQQI